MTEAWHDFFLASVGAAAALAGLIIVAISVNIQAIISIAAMTARAGATVASLVLSLVASATLLVPSRSPRPLAAVILTTAAFAAVISARAAIQLVRVERGRAPVLATVAKVVLAGIQGLPFVVGGALLLGGDGDGVGWVAAGVLVVFVGSVTTAWVLLVEILR